MRRIFLGGQVISMIGDGLALLAVPLLILRLTHDPLAAGLAVAMRSVGYLAVGAPAGPIVDRLNAWLVLVTADAVAAGGAAGILGALIAPRLDARFARVPLVATTIAIASCAVAAMAAARSWWALAAANALLIFASSQGGLLARSIRQELVPRELLGRVTAAARTIFVSATPVGALITGLGTRVAGNDPRPMFLGAGCLLALAIAVAWFSTLRHQVAYQIAPVPAKAGAAST